MSYILKLKPIVGTGHGGVTSLERESVEVLPTSGCFSKEWRKEKDSHTADAFARSTATAGSTISLPEENLCF
jgi:hypothetical protein